MQCATHPSVETELACGRCGKPICPRCLIHSPVGARCRDCANIRRLPQYNISPVYYARAIGAALVSGVVLGFVWRAFFLVSLSFFGIMIGIGVGYAVGEVVSLAVNKKQGLPLQIIAGAGVVSAYVVRNLLLGILWWPEDAFGYLALIIGVVVAAGRLR